MAALLAATAPAQTWTGASSTQWDLPGNWTGGLPTNAYNTVQAVVQWSVIAPGVGGPVIDSNVNTVWGLGRIRGYGLRLLQTGGRHEWQNGTGRVTKGLGIYSRPAECFPQSFEPTDALKALLGKGQRRRSPPQHHAGSRPALDAVGPGFCSGKATLNQIGRAERSDPQLVL